MPSLSQDEADALPLLAEGQGAKVRAWVGCGDSCGACVETRHFHCEGNWIAPPQPATYVRSPSPPPTPPGV